MNVDTFLGSAGWADATRSILAGDASARRYQRLQKGAAHAVLMLAPLATAGPQTQFLRMAHWLRRHGLSAPEIYVDDAETGLILMEDLGDFALLNTLSPDQYHCAADVLADLHRAQAPDFLPHYSAEILAEEAGRLLLWYLPAITGQPVSADFTAAYQAEITTALAPFAHDPQVVILRDYHGQNLHWLPERQGVARIGLLDFQDALIGHPAYDLTSLLGDVRGTVPTALGKALAAHFIAKTQHQPNHFNAALAAFGAQRALKILGLFVRLAQRDAKPDYLRLLPRTWAVLQTALAHPQLAPLAAFVARHIPPPENLVHP